MKQEVSDNTKAIVSGILARDRFLGKNDDGTYMVPISATSDMHMSPEDAAAILSDARPYQKFYDWLDDTCAEAMYDTSRELERSVFAALDINENENEEAANELADAVQSLIRFDLPETKFMEARHNITLMLKPGDCSDGESTMEKLLADGSSLVWLVRQQGYTKDQLRKALEYPCDLGSQFLESCSREALSGMSAVTFLVNMEFEEAMMLNMAMQANKNGSIVLDNDSVTGLFDACGSGTAAFDIMLDKNVEIPFNMIHSALPDNPDKRGVSRVCGFDPSSWERSLMKIIVKY